MYFFTFTGSAANGPSVALQLVKDDVTYVASYAEDDYTDQGSTSIVIPCSAGNQVWLKSQCKRPYFV